MLLQFNYNLTQLSRTTSSSSSSSTPSSSSSSASASESAMDRKLLSSSRMLRRQRNGDSFSFLYYPLVLTVTLLLVLNPAQLTAAERDFNFNDSQVPLIEPKEEPQTHVEAVPLDSAAHQHETEHQHQHPHQHQHQHQHQHHHQLQHNSHQDPYAVELSHCRYGDNEIVLSLILKNYNWHDLNESRRAKVLEKLSKFFAIPKEFITMESVTKHDLYEMQKEALKKGNNKCHQNNRKLGRATFIIGCGTTYFSMGEPISKQITQQVKDGSLDNITGEKFGWWVIWKKHYKARAERNRRQIEGSGDDDADNDDDDYDYEYEDEETIDDPAAGIASNASPERSPAQTEITSNNIDAANTKDDITALKQTDPSEHDDRVADKKTDSNLLLLNKKGTIDAEIVESVSQLESVITKTIENTKNIEPDLPVVEQPDDDIIPEEISANAGKSLPSLDNINLNNVYERPEDGGDKTNNQDFNIAEVMFESTTITANTITPATEHSVSTSLENIISHENTQANSNAAGGSLFTTNSNDIESPEYPATHQHHHHHVENHNTHHNYNHNNHEHATHHSNKHELNENSEIDATTIETVIATATAASTISSPSSSSVSSAATVLPLMENTSTTIAATSAAPILSSSPSSSSSFSSSHATKNDDNSIASSNEPNETANVDKDINESVLYTTTVLPLLHERFNQPTTATTENSIYHQHTNLANEDMANSFNRHPMQTSAPTIATATTTIRTKLFSSAEADSSQSSSLGSVTTFPTNVLLEEDFTTTSAYENIFVPEEVSSSSDLVTITNYNTKEEPHQYHRQQQLHHHRYSEGKKDADGTTLETEDNQEDVNKTSATPTSPLEDSSATTTIASTSAASAAATTTTSTSSEPETTTPAASPDYVEPKAENTPPMIKTRLQKFAVTSGKSFRYAIPSDTFHDNEDFSNLRLDLTDKDGNELKSNSWLQFNAESKEIYGLPLDDAVSKWQYRLTATDSGNESVAETVEISVQQHRGLRTVNHEINVAVKINEKNIHYIDWQMSLINAIATTLGDDNSNSIVVREIRQNPQDSALATLVFFNETLPTSECPEMQLNNLVKRLDAQRLSDLVQPTLGIKSITGQLIGSCQKLAATVKPKLPSIPVKNAPPVLLNQVDHIVATVGHLLVYKVPHDAFFDAENSALKLSLKTKEHKELSARHWLQFDAKNQEFYGVPKSGDAGSEEYNLVAEDAGGLSVSDALVVQVNHAPKKEFSIYIKAYLAVKHEHFNADLQRKFVERIAALFGDVSTQNLQIRSVTTNHDNGGTIVNFYNTTLFKSHNHCPEEEIEAVTSVYQMQERVKKALGPELELTNAQIVPFASCHAQTDTTHREFIPNKNDEPLLKSTFSDNYLYTIILPAVIIVSMIIIASLVACCLHRRRHKSGKMELGDEEERKSFRTKGIPVIFQDELDEKPEIGNKSPIILKDEKPPLLPPSYNTSNMNGDNDVDEYVPPPAVVVGGREARGKSPATPSYRKPPPYVSP